MSWRALQLLVALVAVSGCRVSAMDVCKRAEDADILEGCAPAKEPMQDAVEVVEADRRAKSEGFRLGGEEATMGAPRWRWKDCVISSYATPEAFEAALRRKRGPPSATNCVEGHPGRRIILESHVSCEKLRELLAR